MRNRRSPGSMNRSLSVARATAPALAFAVSALLGRAGFAAAPPIPHLPSDAPATPPATITPVAAQPLPKDAEACFTKGRELGKAGRLTEAAPLFREAVRLSPTTAKYQFQSGNRAVQSAEF